MVEVRACVLLFVVFLCFHLAIAKPMVGPLWCELACVDDDDDITTTPRSRNIDVDDVFCGACPVTRRRNATLRNPAALNAINPNRSIVPWQPNNGGPWAWNWGPGGGPWAQGQGPWGPVQGPWGPWGPWAGPWGPVAPPATPAPPASIPAAGK